MAVVSSPAAAVSVTPSLPRSRLPNRSGHKGRRINSGVIVKAKVSVGDAQARRESPDINRRGDDVISTTGIDNPRTGRRAVLLGVGAAGAWASWPSGNGSGSDPLLPAIASAYDVVPVPGGTALVTGASSGIGFSVAVGLLKRGYTVVPAGRTVARAKDAADKLLSEVPSGKVECVEEDCDLGSLNSVQRYCESYLKSGLPLDSLVECAGIAWCDESRSEDGYELQFATNHLGHFHMANCLTPLLHQAVSPRLVAVSSSAHYAGSCDPTALVNNVDAHPYNRWINYCDSKLCNVLFARKLASREAEANSPIIATSVHPGIVNTNLIRYITPPSLLQAREADVQRSLQAGKFLGLLTPEEGAQGALWLASSSSEKITPGGYYQGSAPPVLTEPSAHAKNDRLATALWAASEVLVARAMGQPEPQVSLDCALAYQSNEQPASADILPGFVRMQMTNG